MKERPALRPVIVVVAFVVWLGLLSFPVPATGRFLDHGWGFGLAHFLKTGAQAGADYLFTYGPLGYLAVVLYVPGLFGLKYVWAIVFAGAYAVLITRFMTHLQSRWLWVPWVWAVLTVVPGSDVEALVFLMLAALVQVFDDSWTSARLTVTGLLLASLALVKFSFLVLAVLLLGGVILAVPRGQRTRCTATLGGVFAATFLFQWVVTRQSLSNIPHYVAMSLDLARGYSDAMSLSAQRTLVPAALQAIGLLVLSGALAAPFLRHRTAAAAHGIVLLGLFVTWKEGFVRQDVQHESCFFAYVALAPFFLVAATPSGGQLALLRSGWLALASFSGIAAVRTLGDVSPLDQLSLSATRERIGRNIEVLANPLAYRAYADRVWAEQREQWRLPAVAARVGSRSIDVVSWDQSILLWNDLNWRPRPVFQGYAAFTPALADWNGAFYSGPRAPDFVLFRWMGIDRRFPPHDDPSALLAILRGYHPVLTERDYILLERRPEGTAASREGEVVFDQHLPFEERLPLAFDRTLLHTLSVRVSLTFEGKLRRFFYRLPHVYLVLQQDNAVVKRYELIAGLASTEFVLNPLFEGNIDVPWIYAGVGRQLVSLRLIVDDEGVRCFGDGAEVTIRRYEGIGQRKESLRR